MNEGKEEGVDRGGLRRRKRCWDCTATHTWAGVEVRGEPPRLPPAPAHHAGVGRGARGGAGRASCYVSLPRCLSSVSPRRFGTTHSTRLLPPSPPLTPLLRAHSACEAP